jgi:hypothetical protein
VGTLLDIFWGLLLCLGATLGIGYSILLQPAAALISFALGAVGAIGVARWLRREDAAVPAGKPPLS